MTIDKRKRYDIKTEVYGNLIVELLEETEKDLKFRLLDNFGEAYLEEDEDTLTISKKENVWVLNPKQW